MGCIAGIVETGGRTAATAPREFEDGGQDRTGPGTRGRMERAGQLRCRVSFNSSFYQNHQCDPGGPGGPPCVLFLISMMSKFPTLTRTFSRAFSFETQILVDGKTICGCDFCGHPQA